MTKIFATLVSIAAIGLGATAGAIASAAITVTVSLVGSALGA
jgi:hypothetical protein